MEFPSRFICAGPAFSTLESFVPAPYFRKTFEVSDVTAPCNILVTGLGFYRIWVNGREITKGLLAPYISNPDHFVYFDEYDLSPYLVKGENALGFQLGNGMRNAPGGAIWDFDDAPFRGAPCLSFALEYEGGRLEADRSVKTAPSPVYFDDLRCGVRCDARNEKPGWNTPGYNDADWKPAEYCDAPKGEKRLAVAEPIRPTGRVLRAVSVKPAGVAPYHVVGKAERFTDPESAPKEGLLFDFGEDNAGYCRLKVNGKPGQRISMQFAEFETDGNIDYSNINFFPDGMSQRDIYICAGGEAVFAPPFTYHGFRYCLVNGLTEEQVKDDTLEFVVCTSDIPAAGSFRCSDETANELYRMADRIAVYNNGHIEAIGEKHALFSAPGTYTAALLTGCKNFSAVSDLRRENGRTLFTADDWGVELSVPGEQAGDVVGMRRHYIRLAEGPGENICRMEIDSVTEDPFECVVFLRRPGFQGVPLGWAVPKEEYHTLPSGPLWIHFPDQALMLLKK